MLLTLTVGAGAFASDKYVVHYNQSDGSEKSLGYKVLELALSKSGKQYTLAPAPIKYSNSSAQFEAIANGADLDVVWASASKSAAEKVDPIPFPIDGGLLGYRIFLIDGARQADFNNVNTLADLKNFIALQGAGWADVKTLQAAGLTVRTGPRKNLYKMTVGKRGDYFARAAFEAVAEQKANVGEVPELAIEKNLVLRYRSAQIYYVAKGKTELKEDILKGLEAAWSDGSYKQIFNSDANVIAALGEANLKGRRQIEIENPGFPTQLSNMDAKYWFDPSQN